MINKILANRYFPLSLKVISLFVFIGLMIIGFSAHSSDAALLKQLRNTNLANLFVWSYWWPSIIVAAIFFGRIWCMVCPVEIITSFFAKMGFKLKRPKWLLSGWAISLFYLVILVVGINIFAIHRNPAYMAGYLSAIIGVAILTGLFYKKNTFCRYVCPVGYLLGIYSRLSAWGWRVKDNQTCDTCKDKSCIHKDYRYSMNYKSCGVDLYPAKIENNSTCILCAGCLKTCKTYQSEPNEKRPNLGFGKVGFANGLFNGKPMQVAEWFFLFVVSGFVIYEILSEYSSAKSVLLYFPKYFSDLLSISNATVLSLIQSFYLFFLLPAIFWFSPYLLIRLGKINLSLKKYITYFGLAFIPIVAAVHLCKSILKITSRIPYFEFLKGDIIGIETAKAITSNEITLQSLPVWLEWLITIAMTGIIIFGLVISLKVINRVIDKLEIKKNIFVFRLITISYFFVFFIDLLIWRWL